MTQVTRLGLTMGANDTIAMDGNLSNPLQANPAVGLVNAGSKTDEIPGVSAPTPSNDTSASSPSGINVLPSPPLPTLPNTVPTSNTKPKGKSKSGVAYKDTGTLTARFVNFYLHYYRLINCFVLFCIRNLCGIDWIQHNPGGLKSDFDIYFKGLSDEELQVRKPNYALCYTLLM